jgi:hypothetical protein
VFPSWYCCCCVVSYGVSSKQVHVIQRLSRLVLCKIRARGFRLVCALGALGRRRSEPASQPEPSGISSLPGTAAVSDCMHRCSSEASGYRSSDKFCASVRPDLKRYLQEKRVDNPNVTIVNHLVMAAYVRDRSSRGPYFNSFDHSGNQAPSGQRKPG